MGGMRYAQGTTVPIERSRVEVERILQAAGAIRTAIVRDGSDAEVGFELKGRCIKVPIHVPTIEKIWDEAVKEEPWGWKSKSDSQRKRWCEERQIEEQRRRWRVLVILLKAKLEAIADEASTIDQEFLYFVVVKGGGTIGEHLEAQLEEIYSGQASPKLLGPRSK